MTAGARSSSRSVSRRTPELRIFEPYRGRHQVKVCIYGAGAIGGFIGARLGASSCELSAVARGATLAALNARGMRLQLKDELVTAKVRAVEDPAALGAQDLVVVAVKAPALAAIARAIGPLIGPDTMVLTAMNGVPWWFFHGFGGKYTGTQLKSVDADGSIAAAIPSQSVIGCVVHAAASVPEPGLVRHAFGNRLILGEPDGDNSERVRSLAALFAPLQPLPLLPRKRWPAPP